MALRRQRLTTRWSAPTPIGTGSTRRHATASPGRRRAGFVSVDDPHGVGTTTINGVNDAGRPGRLLHRRGGQHRRVPRRPLTAVTASRLPRPPAAVCISARRRRASPRPPVIPPVPTVNAEPVPAAHRSPGRTGNYGGAADAGRDDARVRADRHGGKLPRVGRDPPAAVRLRPDHRAAGPAQPDPPPVRARCRRRAARRPASPGRPPGAPRPAWCRAAAAAARSPTSSAPATRCRPAHRPTGATAAADSYCATAAPRSPSLTARETNSAASNGHRAASRADRVRHPVLSPNNR